MKHHIKDSLLRPSLPFVRLGIGLSPIWRGVVVFILLTLTLALTIVLPSAVSAQTLSPTKMPNIDGPGTLIEFIEGEYILVDGLDVPQTGWTRAPNPNVNIPGEMGWRVGDYHTLLGRFYFDREAVGDESVAIYTVGMRNNFTIYVNGTEVFRNFANINDQKNAWYRPFLITLPDNDLKVGTNEILIHAYSKATVGIGRVVIGSNSALKDYHKAKFFWQITAPIAANFALLLIGALVFLLWLGRRHETELLWLSISSALWFARNHQFFSETVPFNVGLYTTLPVYATYFGGAASASFYLCFTKLPQRNKIISFMFLAGIILIVIDLLFGPSEMPFYFATMFVALIVAALGCIELVRYRNIERGLLGFVMMLMPIFNSYDLFIALFFAKDGSISYISVFVGLLYTVIFLISFGKRALDAFMDLGNSNLVLEQRIAETRAELAASETLRQELVVEQAIADERGRLMQEMHDGIGSNLITALAVARQQRQPKTTIKILGKALGDLKITVDSLEPVEGDLVALIGNLRHRMAGDLKDAGVVCIWDVGECAPLPWLGATNALHVLRICNEAIGNVLTHSGASEMKIGCFERDHKGVAGISVYIMDNGIGFDTRKETLGKGLVNIKARAKSLHGFLSYESSPNGTVFNLWLPYVRKV